MSWLAVRRFVGAWIGATMGHLFAGTGALHQLGTLPLLWNFLREGSGNVAIGIGSLMVFSAVYAIGLILGLPERDERNVPVRRFLQPSNYFRYGAISAVLAWLVFAAFAGLVVNLDLIKWIKEL